MVAGAGKIAFVPDAVALRDDYTAAAMALEDATDQRTLRYLTQFLGGLARCVDDNALEREMDALADLQSKGVAVQSQVARIAGLVQDRLSETAPI